jgi:hypothetical protein
MGEFALRALAVACLACAALALRETLLSDPSKSNPTMTYLGEQTVVRGARRSRAPMHRCIDAEPYLRRQHKSWSAEGASQRAVGTPTTALHVCILLAVERRPLRGYGAGWIRYYGANPADKQVWVKFYMNVPMEDRKHIMQVAHRNRANHVRRMLTPRAANST